MNVIVVGGGLSGLTLSYQLQKQGISTTLLEAADSCGGVITTHKRDGFLLEQGPNSSLAKPEFMELLEELSLLDELVEPEAFAKNRYLLHNKTNPELLAVPKGPGQMLLWPGLSLAAKLRALCEPLLARRTTFEDETVGSFVTRHFGSEVANQIVAPMLGGIWAADINTLSCRSALPALWHLEQGHRSVVAGALKRYLGKASRHNKARPHIVSLQNGLGTLITALLQALTPESICCGAEVEKIEHDGESYQATYFRNGIREVARGSHLALCLPAGPTANLLEPMDASLASRIRGVPYAPLGVTHLRAKRSDVRHPLDGFGLLVPPHLGFSTLGVIFSSSLFAGRAPEGECLLTCFSGGAINPAYAEVAKTEVQQCVVDEVRSFLGIRTTPEVVERHFWNRAVPNYPLAHDRTQSAVERFVANHRGMHVLGNWYKGISLNDRIAQAKNTAREIGKSQSTQPAIEEEAFEKTVGI